MLLRRCRSRIHLWFAEVMGALVVSVLEHPTWPAIMFMIRCECLMRCCECGCGHLRCSSEAERMCVCLLLAS